MLVKTLKSFVWCSSAKTNTDYEDCECLPSLQSSRSNTFEVYIAQPRACLFFLLFFSAGLFGVRSKMERA